MEVDGKYYEIARPESLAEKLVIRARDRIYNDFLRLCQPSASTRILDIGVSDVTTDAANVLERRYPHPERLTAVGLGTADSFVAAFPKIAYRQIIANEGLPFPDNTFDIATSNAVLEHVGSSDNQRRFIIEALRVAQRGFFTIPHRFFPIEHHTGIPFLHWTDATFALTCRLLGKQSWARQENLILMTRKRLLAVCPECVKRLEVGVTGIDLGPWGANLYLYIER